MKKILFLLLMLIFVVPVEALNTTISIEDSTADVGKEFSVPVKITDAQDIGSFDITITYDSSILDAKEVAKSDLTEKSMLDYNIEDGKIKIAIVDAEGISGGGKIAEIWFKVLKEGECKLDIEASANSASNYMDVELQTQDGKFSSKSGGKSEESPGFTVITAIGVTAMVLFSFGKRRRE